MTCRGTEGFGQVVGNYHSWVTVTELLQNAVQLLPACVPALRGILLWQNKRLRFHTMGVNMQVLDDSQIQDELKELQAQEQAIAVTMQVELGETCQHQADQLMEEKTNVAL